MIRVFRKRALRRIFRPERDEVTGQWRILHSEELTDLYCSANIIRVIKSISMRWAGLVVRMEGEEMCVQGLVGKREGKRTFRRPRRKSEDNIKMDTKEVSWGHGLD